MRLPDGISGYSAPKWLNVRQGRPDAISPAQVSIDIFNDGNGRIKTVAIDDEIYSFMRNDAGLVDSVESRDKAIIIQRDNAGQITGASVNEL